MNITGAPEPFGLATVEQIQLLRDVSTGTDTRTDIIEAAIKEVSAEFADFLGMHVARRLRTEVYELRQHRKTISLTGTDVDTSSILVRAGVSPAPTNTWQTLTAGTHYTVSPSIGILRLYGWQTAAPLFVEVTYTGGLWSSTTDRDITRKHAWLSDLGKRQIIYRLQRQDTLGGNLQVGAGGGTQFSGQYRMLQDVESALKRHRRVAL